MDERLQRLAAQSEHDDALIVELVYHDKFVQFDISAMELKYLSMADIIDRYFAKAFADVQVTIGEQEPARLAAAAETTT